MNLAGKIAIITGASGGLGAVVTQQFLTAGAKVVGVDRSPHSKNAAHPSLTHMAVELAAPAATRKLVQDTLDLHGRLDAVVHLVGGYAGGLRIDETDEETWQGMFAVNLEPAYVLAHAALPVMRSARRGAFLAIGSEAASEPTAGVGAYAASKAALISLVRTIAVENREFAIRANIISPGTMDTHANRTAMPEVDPSRWVQPASVASLIAWLVSDQGAEVTGAVIPLPGR